MQWKLTRHKRPRHRTTARFAAQRLLSTRPAATPERARGEVAGPRSKTPWRHLAIGGLRHLPKPCYNSSPLLRPWFTGACRELKTPWPKAPAGAEAAFGVFDQGPATSPLAHSGAAVGLVEGSRWAAYLAVALSCGRFCHISVRCVPRDFFGGDRCAAGSFSGGDRCAAGVVPPARCLYKGAFGGGVPPTRRSFAFIVFEKLLLALFAFASCCPRASRLSVRVSLLGCCRGGFSFRLRPNSPARLLRTLPPPSRR